MCNISFRRHTIIFFALTLFAGFSYGRLMAENHPAQSGISFYHHQGDFSDGDSLTTPLGEGFYSPGTINLPKKVRWGLHSVVRVVPEIKFRAHIYADSEKAKTMRSEGRSKEFLPEGGVIWNSHIDTATLNKLCNIPIAQVQPGLREVCSLNWQEKCSGFPCTLITKPLAGSGTGVVIGMSHQHGVLIATPYHVARESIERHERTEGTEKIKPVPAPDITIGLDTTGPNQAGGYTYTEDVTLLANASEKSWQNGQDWALLAIPEAYARYVKPARLTSKGASVDDTLWAAGFPYKTIRQSAQKKGYENASNELRISVGRTVSGDAYSEKAISPTDIVNTMDAVNGNSGSPVFNHKGEVVGMIRTGHCPKGKGEINLRIARYCGVTLITPIETLIRFIKE